MPCYMPKHVMAMNYNINMWVVYIIVWKYIVINTQQDASLWDSASEFIFGSKIGVAAPVQLVHTYCAAQNNTNTIWVSISSVFQYIH
jgi:hypothetical protein